MRHLSITVCIAGLASLVSCGASPAAAPVSVGTVFASDAVVALGMSDGQWVFYVCGGSATFATMTRWFTGMGDIVSSGNFEGAEQGWSVHGERRAGRWSGTLTSPDGTARIWQTDVADATTLTGLYEVVDSGCRTGVIVRQVSASDAPSVQGTWCDDHGSFQQVTPIQPLAYGPESLHVRIALPNNARDLYVSRVLLPLR